ncbi:MAG: HEAT repeat domain-containing protein [Gemmatimonadetes bacterium]|nr:HEAT repeat domain-containing protein [Gemmatimonadota bacterium]MCC6773643.1 HEAT repeat domain-containing protein [Gemmatimonadaceae bacterium]
MTVRLLSLRALLVVGALGTAAPAHGQDAAQRLAHVRDGRVRFTVALRPEVCGSGQNVWRTRDGQSRTTWGERNARDVEYDVDCDAGPGRVVIDKDGGVVSDLRFYVGGRWRAGASVTDLGAVGVREATALLVSIARTTDGKAGRNAIFPLTLIDSVEVWRELMQLARDDSRPRETRRQAVFWLGQLAEAPATAGLDELVGEAALDRDVREQAIFALSQRPKDEGVPALVNIVRTNRDPALRRKALFWLGQSGDPRALALIEELLAKR